MKYKTIHLLEVDSTNNYIKQNIEKLDDFTFVSTNYQSRGKGRNDRVWLANKNENLMFSLLIKNTEILEDFSYISLVTAVTVTEVLEEYSLTDIQIKWPNDIYVNDRKIAGILLEGRLPDYLVLGIGINVNQKEFAGEYRKTPTSIFIESNTETYIEDLKEKLYQKLFENLYNFKSKKNEFIVSYNKHDYLYNKNVSFVYNKTVQNGRVLGVDNEFNIVIKNCDGEHHISSGEIELIK